MLSELAETLVPYTAGEQPHDRSYIKLNTNENPYPPSPRVSKVIANFNTSALRLYPDSSCSRLRGAIAEKERVKIENVFVGNGSDEVLAFAFAALFNKDKPVKFADITYSFYPVYCNLFSLKYEFVPLDAKWRINRKGYGNAAGAVIANPNAPTGIYEDVSEFIGKNYPVIIDEAYIDFSDGKSLAAEAASSDNAVVVKTFSKSYSLAGLRCGYAVANENIIKGLIRIKNSFNSYSVNAVTQAAAYEAICDTEYFNENVKKIKTAREKYRVLLEKKGYAIIESQANFLLVAVPDGNAEQKYEYLKANGVLVRYFGTPGLKDKLRITVGTEEEMRLLYNFM